MVVMSVSSALPRSAEEKIVHRNTFTGEVSYDFILILGYGC